MRPCAGWLSGKVPTVTWISDMSEKIRPGPTSCRTRAASAGGSGGVSPPAAGGEENLGSAGPDLRPFSLCGSSLRVPHCCLQPMRAGLHRAAGHNKPGTLAPSPVLLHRTIFSQLIFTTRSLHLHVGSSTPPGLENAATSLLPPAQVLFLDAHARPIVILLCSTTKIERCC